MKLLAIALTALTLVGFSSGCSPHEQKPVDHWKHMSKEDEKWLNAPPPDLNKLP